MKVEYIYAVGQKIWSDLSDNWLFSEPLHDHGQALVVYELGLAPEQCLKLIVMPENGALLHEAGAGLRRLLAASDEKGFAMLSRAAQVSTWHQDHKFCPRCGSRLQHHNQDLAKECVGCGLLQYPRISPCIITLVTDGDYCLLAHGIRFQEKRYSTLAGFIEAGESAEEALIREVREEVGVEVRNITYFKSQSWPFPHALMFGYFADYAGGEIVLQPEEIVDAQWFHYADLPAMPPGFSISRQLIDHFIAERTAANVQGTSE